MNLVARSPFKALFVSLLFCMQAFSNNLILDCDVTLVGVEGKDKASNDTEIIDINFKAKTIFFGSEAIPYKLKNRIRIYEGI